MPELAVLFFGKLPHYSDFIRFNAAGPDVRGLDQWLQECLYFAARHFGSDWSAVYQAAAAYYFVFHAVQTETALVGILQPSHDKSDRKFPFITAYRIPKKHVEPRMIPLMPMMLSPLLRDLRTIVEDGLNGSSSAEISARAEALSGVRLEDYESTLGAFETYLRSTTGERFWSGQFGEYADTRKYLIIKNLHEVFESRGPGRPARANLGARFPLSPNASGQNEEVSFWISLGSAVFGRLEDLPNMFWGLPAGPARTHFFLFLERPPVKSFIPLVKPATESDAICRLDEDGREGVGEVAQHLPERQRLALESQESNLRELIDAFRSRADPDSYSRS